MAVISLLLSSTFICPNAKLIFEGKDGDARQLINLLIQSDLEVVIVGSSSITKVKVLCLVRNCRKNECIRNGKTYEEKTFIITHYTPAVLPD